MKRMISVIDLQTGTVTARASDTRTLDVPADFDRDATAAALDEHSRAQYRASSGKDASCTTHPRPLSWRVRGEECLIAEGAVSGRGAGRYTLCTVDPDA